MDWEDMLRKAVRGPDLPISVGISTHPGLGNQASRLASSSASRSAAVPIMQPRNRITPRLILASASPRRRQLLAEAGLRFEIEPADIDEEAAGRGVSLDRLAETLAAAKAQAVAKRHTGLAVIILAADTIVISASGHLLGKPADRADARRILQALSGTVHHVITGYSCVRCDEGNRNAITGQQRSEVRMRPLSSDEIEAYLETGQWEGKAGAYGIQDTPGQRIGEGDPFIQSISGELTNVVGLPMPQVRSALQAMGIAASER